LITSPYNTNDDDQVETEKELRSLATRLGLKDLSEASFFPKYFEVETIRACNARCRMCTVWKWQDKNGQMADSLFSKILGEIAGYAKWIDGVCLSRNGEPLLDNDLSEKIRKLKACGIRRVTFSTNASLMDEAKSISLIESGLDEIMFSVDGITKKTFESIRRGLNFERVMENCLNFITLRNDRGTKPRIRARMVLQKENRREEGVWKDFWLARLSKQDEVSSKPVHSWGGQLSNYEEPYNTERDSRLPCISPWSTMVIHFDGKVPLCGCDFNNKILMGDLSKSSIKEIFESENFIKVRKIHASGKRDDIPLCRGCHIWNPQRKRIYKRNTKGGGTL